MTSEMAIVPATPELVRQFAGKTPPLTFRGHVAMVGDRVLGLGGIYYQDGVPVIFSEFKEGLGIKDRARCFRFIEQVAAKWKGQLHAICDISHPGSPGLLRRLGFSPVHDTHWVRT